MDVLVNYTPDPVSWIHGGSNGTMRSGELVEFDRARANYLVTKFGPRGIQRLKFGDDPEKAKADAMRIWKQFWTRQVVVFNQDNERRQNTNREYVHPTEELEDHATRLGIKLVGPWTLRDTDDSAVRLLRDENETLKAQMRALTEQMSALVDAVKGSGTPIELRTTAEKVVLAQEARKVAERVEDVKPSEDPEPSKEEPVDQKKLIIEFQMLNRDKFLQWVSENSVRLQSEKYPAEVLSLVKQKWEKLIANTDWPFPD